MTTYDKIKQYEQICGLNTKGKYAQRPQELDCGCGAPIFIYNDHDEAYVCQNCGDFANEIMEIIY